MANSKLRENIEEEIKNKQTKMLFHPILDVSTFGMLTNIREFINTAEDVSVRFLCSMQTSQWQFIHLLYTLGNFHSYKLYRNRIVSYRNMYLAWPIHTVWTKLFSVLECVYIRAK